MFRDLQDIHSFAPLESQMEKPGKPLKTQNFTTFRHSFAANLAIHRF